MNSVKIFNYEGSNITFKQGDVTMVNATEMAKPFGKRTSDWYRLSSTSEFLKALESETGIPATSLVKVFKGGEAQFQGTWVHEDVAIEFARWLSPRFAIWCNKKIKELLTDGQTSLKPLSKIELAKMIIESEEEKVQLQLLVDEQKEELKKTKPKTEYFDKVMDTKDSIPVTVIANELGTTAQKLNSALHFIGVQYKVNGTWVLYAKYKGSGYTFNKTHVFTGSDGETRSRVVLEWTQKGRAFIHYALKKSGITFLRKVV